MKKLLAAVLACAMLFALACPVFAAGNFAATAAQPEEADLLSVSDAAGPAVSKTQPKYPVKADVEGTFYGYFYNGGESGPGEYDLATGEITRYSNTFTNMIYCGAYVGDKQDGAYYAIYAQGTTFVLARFDDFKAGDYTDLGVAPEQPMAMAMNNKTNVLYVMGRSSTIYAVDVKGGSFTAYATLTGFDNTPLVMSIDGEGNMYIITLTGSFYKVDLPSGECTFVGTPGITPGFVQSMTYDVNTDALYWFSYTTAREGSLVTINPETAEIIDTFDIDPAPECLAMTTIPEKLDVPEESAEITELKLEPTELDLIGGDKVQLGAIVEPMDKYVADRSVTFVTDDENVATVTDGGMLTARFGGETKITATAADGKTTAECAVKVTDAMDLYGDLSDALNKVARGEDGYIMFRTGEPYPFTAEEVEGHGMVGMCGNHTQGTTDYFMNSSFETVFPIHMIGGSTLSFEYFIDTDAVYCGMIFTVNGEYNLVVDGQHEEWETYTFTAPATGDYEFSWTYAKNYYLVGDATQDILMVNDIELTMAESSEVESITLVPEEMTLLVNATQQLEVVFEPVSVENTNVTFESEDPEIASVNANGLVVARAAGKTKIVATSEDGGKTAEAIVNVIEPLEVPTMTYNDAKVDEKYEVTLDAENVEYVFIDGIIKFAAGYKLEIAEGKGAILTVTPGENPAADTMVLVYDSEFNLVAFNDDGEDLGSYSKLKFIPEEAGTYYVVVTTAAAYTVDSGEVVLTIEDYDPVHVTEVKVPANVSVGLDKFMKLTVALLPEGNDFPELTYESSDEGIVKVSDDGVLYGVSEGTATVTVTSTDGNLSAQTEVLVEQFENPEADGMIYAYNIYEIQGDLTTGFLKFDPEANTMEMVNPGLRLYQSGTYHNGMLYAYYTESMGNFYKVHFVKIDIDDFTVQQDVVISSQMIPSDMTYDYTDNTVYATIIDSYTSMGNRLAKVDLYTGEFTEIADFEYGVNVRNLEADSEGTLYAITTAGKLYTVDKTNAKLTEIRDMEIQNPWVNTMTYDHDAKLMYWFPMDPTATSHVVVFDPATGELESDDPTPGGVRELTFGFNFTEPEKVTHTVTFLGLDKEVVATVTVEHGADAEAPDMTRDDGLKFGLWDKDFTNVQEDLTVQGYYCGDTNMSAIIDAGDATLILRDVVDLEKLEGDAALLANVNANDEIDAGDATLVLRYVVGLNLTENTEQEA